MSKTIIETHNLTKDYGDNRGIFDININIKEGEAFGFIGTNGSGKTTTIRNMMGFIKPDKGDSFICGLDSWSKSAEIMKKVSYVPGEIAFPGLATGTKFLKSQAEYLGVKDFTYMNHLVEKLQLDPSADLKRMSKGMKQKTAIVAALMGRKDILVLDEPTTGLDPLMREGFLDLVREEKAQGHTVFMSSHIFEEIEAVCDRVAMIKDGHVLDVVSVNKIKNPDEKTFTITFEDGTERIIKVSKNEMQFLFETLKEQKIINIQERHTSLQEHFMMEYKKGEKSNGQK